MLWCFAPLELALNFARSPNNFHLWFRPLPAPQSQSPPFGDFLPSRLLLPLSSAAAQDATSGPPQLVPLPLPVLQPSLVRFCGHRCLTFSSSEPYSVLTGIWLFPRALILLMAGPAAG